MELIQTEDAKKTAGNLSSSFLIRILRYPFLAFYIIIIPHMLGASDYGQLALYISVVMLASEVLTFGTTLVFGRFAPEYIHKNENLKLEQLVSGYLILELIIALILALAGMIVLFILQPELNKIYQSLIIYFAIIFEIYSGILFSVLYGLNYIGKSSTINLFRTAFRLIFLLILYPIFGFTAALFSLLLTPFISSLYAIYSIRKVIKFKIRKPILKEFIPKLKFGIIIFTPTLLFLFQQQIGPLFLKSFSFNNNEVGFFDLANQGFLVLYGLAATGFDALIPISSKFQVIGKHGKSIDWLLMVLRYILPPLLIIIIGFYLFGEILISIILGNEFINIYPIAIIILLSVPIWIIGQLGYVRSVSLSKPKPYVISTVFSTIIFLTFAFFSIKHLGAKGLAIAVLMSGATYSLIITILYKELIKSLVTIITKICIALLAFVPFLFFKPENIELGIVLLTFSSFVFLLILKRLGIININEIKQLISAIRKKA